jgi:hypothetical protein
VKGKRDTTAKVYFYYPRLVIRFLCCGLWRGFFSTFFETKVTWKEFKEKIELAIKESNSDENVKIFYIDVHLPDKYMEARVTNDNELVVD